MNSNSFRQLQGPRHHIPCLDASNHICPQLRLDPEISTKMGKGKRYLLPFPADLKAVFYSGQVLPAKPFHTEKDDLCSKPHHQKWQVDHNLKQGHILVYHIYIISG